MFRVATAARSGMTVRAMLDKHRYFMQALADNLAISTPATRCPNAMSDESRYHLALQ